MKYLNPVETWPATDDNPNGFSTTRLNLDNYMSYSRIKTLLQSPGHFKLRYIDGEAFKPSAEMEFGKLVHKALLERGDFRKRFVVAPDKNNGKFLKTKDDLLAYAATSKIPLNKSAKKGDMIDALLLHCPGLRDDIWDCVQLDFTDSIQAGQIGITHNESEIITGMASVVGAHPIAPNLITRGCPELWAYWTDKELGVVWCACLDYIKIIDRNKKIDIWMSEYKTTKDASLHGFSKQIDTMLYHVQSWVYERVITGITGVNPNVVHMAQEKKPPYGLGLYSMDVRSMELAEGQVRVALASFNKCMEEDNWPVYPETIQTVGLPAYAVYRIEEQEDKE